MKNILQTLTENFSEAAVRAFPQIPQHELAIEITPSTQPQFGDYQCNSAMKLAKLAKLNPRQVAEALLKELISPIIASTEIAGPGFINIRIKPEVLAIMANEMLHADRLAIELPASPDKVIIDFSSPNTAKEMHVGHLRSTIIGDALARLLEFKGHHVLRLNHVGDWGTAFGMLIAHIKEQAPQVLQTSEGATLTDLVRWYKESKHRFDNDPAFKKTAQQEVVLLQGGDKETLKGWKVICEISRKAYQEVYDLLGIKITERGESFYNPMLPMIVAELENKGMVTVSDGAKCIFLDGFQNREGMSLPLMVQKSDGGYNYDTTDMAAIYQRLFEEKGNRLIYVTDAGQATHFQMIFKAAEKAGWLDPNKVKAEHVPFGLVLGADGKKFRTRSGDTEKLMDLLDTAVEQAKKILDERNPDMSEAEKQALAKTLGIGSVKYADLSCNRVGDYTFSYDRMLKFEGNTAPYLLYSYVRVQGIKRKVGQDVQQVAKTAAIAISHPSEIALALHLVRFSEALDQVAKDLLPNRLAEYLYSLAEKFNAFFRDCRVEGSAEQNSRLLLCELTAQVLKQGLHLLGLNTTERM